MPFSEAQFLDVFATFNRAFAPLLAALWILTLVATAGLVRNRASARMVSAVLALHWIWSAVAYHAASFTRVNPAAWLFAALFFAQGAGFLWVGIVNDRLAFEWRSTMRHGWAAVFLAFGLLYPALVALSGHALPRAPAFGVPCPTTLWTAGVLLTAMPSLPRSLLVGPIVWSMIGGTAAVLFGMTPDLMLFAAGAVLLAYGVGHPRGHRFEWEPRPAEQEAS
jgi:hypothetical protein